ncbi:MAG: hypothetical protein KGL16_10870, partial [Acidobacteriota bacterium]|nr:hypothetical protein [Acidobacteriota bacterium]
MNGGRRALWALLALFGIVLAAGLSWSVVRLSGVHIGLASAPISVVRGLAPGPAARAMAQPEKDRATTVTRAAAVNTATTERASKPGSVATRLSATTTSATGVRTRSQALPTSTRAETATGATTSAGATTSPGATTSAGMTTSAGATTSAGMT